MIVPPFPGMPRPLGVVFAATLGATTLLTPAPLAVWAVDPTITHGVQPAEPAAEPTPAPSSSAGEAMLPLSEPGPIRVKAISVSTPVRLGRTTPATENKAATPAVSPVEAEASHSPALARDALATPFRQAQPSVPAVAPEDLELMRQAIVEYRQGRLTEGDAIATRAQDEAAKLALEWAAIRLGRQAVGFTRLAKFAESHPDFPMAAWVRRRAEEALFVENQPPARIQAFFERREPEMAAGKVVLARLMLQRGDETQAKALVRSAWRENRSSNAIRAAILKEFPGAVSPEDMRHLAEKLIHRGETAEGLRIAALAGPAAVTMANILVASVNETGGAMALLMKLEAPQQGEAAASFARVQHFRRANQIPAAVQAMLLSPREAAKLADPDEWWIERRLMTRKALDSGDAANAYRIAAEHAAASPQNKVDAEVHAGWVALQFLGKADDARAHFARARAEAMTPHSIARAAYWQGRAADALGQEQAQVHYRDAAQHAHVFYGQLARARLTQDRSMPEPTVPAADDLEAVTRLPALRAMRALLEAEMRELVQPLIADAAQNAPNLAYATAIGDLTARFGLPRLTLLAGKQAMQKGLRAEQHAFPVFGIPPYEASPELAEPAVVYSIARQESEFDPGAISHAGARGLMQLMPETARRTATKAKMPFDVNALTRDPALNARIGAAHLGELFAEYNGSYILAFAAYNAGGKRVKEWIAAYGDPRDPQVDKVDWIERIPITETRNYVQKVLENLQVYRHRLNREAAPGILADLTRGARRAKGDLAQTGG